MVFVSRMPPVPCGVAEYTSMLISELSKIPALTISVVGGDAVDYPLGFELQDSYSGVTYRNCFMRGDVLYLPKCLENLEKPQLVHIQHEVGIFPDVVSLANFMKSLRAQGVKIVLTLHTVIHALGGEALITIQKHLVENSDAVIVHSVLQEQELLRQGIPVEKVHLIPHGTLLNPFVGQPRELLIQSLPLPRDIVNKKVVCIAGFVRSRDKDYSPVIKAVDALADRYNVKLVIAGMPRRKDTRDVILEETLRRVIRENGNVYYLEGFLDRFSLLKLLALSDVVVLPIVDVRNYPVSVSGVFHLAIGSRKPVLCTRSHKLVECNFLAPELTLRVFTAEEITRKIEEVLLSKEEVSRAVEKLWSYALETRWEVVARKHYELYRELLS
ncbi:MAG: glycosyltransferase [Desulfurococcaceae archaeon]